MKILDTIHSKIDKTVKYVLQLRDGMITEVAYINKDDGKDILCVSSQTACPMGCKFCHTTDCKDQLTLRNLGELEIFDAIETVYNDLKLRDNHRLLLVSYMGCGEPLCNTNFILGSMLLTRAMHSNCRFAIATMLPATHWHYFFDLLKRVSIHNLKLKVHLSLHFVNDGVRKEWMPRALDIKPSLTAMEFWQQMGGQVEIHYTMIEGVNDLPGDIRGLISLLKQSKIPVKLLKYNRRELVGKGPSGSQTVREFQTALDSVGIPNEYYDPPGSDVGSSCGQFLMDYYIKYNGKH